jgi:hypothetical protein
LYILVFKFVWQKLRVFRVLSGRAAGRCLAVDTELSISVRWHEDSMVYLPSSRHRARREVNTSVNERA